jgi:DNA-binding HxlR family transcriptional regulator
MISVMATMRTYGDGCAIAQGLDVVGERWALLVVRELLLGPKRYTDLRRGLAKASPAVLSQRLAELEHAGVIRKRMLPPPAATRVYELTDWGRELETTVTSIGNWAARSPSGLSTDAPIRSADSMILALRSRFDSAAAHDLRARYELRLGDDRFRIEVAEAQLDVARADAEQPDATIATDLDTLAGVLWAGRSVADARRAGAMTIEGDAAAVERLVQLFPVPEPLPAAPVS